MSVKLLEYELNLNGETTLQLPRGADVISARIISVLYAISTVPTTVQAKIVLHVIGDDSKKLNTRYFTIVELGSEIPEKAVHIHTFNESFIGGYSAKHVFELIRCPRLVPDFVPNWEPPTPPRSCI